MWIKNRLLLFWLCLLFFSALFLPHTLSGEHVLTDQEWEQAQSYIRTLLQKSESSEEKSLLIETLSDNLVQKSQSLQAELNPSPDELKQVLAELNEASKSVEILNQVAEKLGISPDNLEAILPTLEQQAEDWLKYSQSIERSRNIWRGIGIGGIIVSALSLTFAAIAAAR